MDRPRRIPEYHPHPCTEYKNKSLLMKQAKKRSNKADNTTQPVSEQHPNWVSNATTRRLGALLPALSSTYCIFDGSGHIDAIASLAPKGTQEEQGKVTK